MVMRNDWSRPTSDWRDRALYKYTDLYSDRCWAWEGLRRNREFQDAWHEAKSDFEIIACEQSVRVIKADGFKSGLNRWGILYCDPPHIDAGRATVLWQSECVPVLNVIAVPAGASFGVTRFCLNEARCSTTVVDASDGQQHVLFLGAGCSIQLRVSGESVLHPIHLLTDAAPDTADLKSHLQTLAQFDELRTTGKCESIKRVQKGRADRLRLVVQALDGFLQDATLREIAIAVFGAERVERDWNDEHRHLKDRVRRAVARGRWLMDGGYRKYLK